jgi:hypothetical protein
MYKTIAKYYPRHNSMTRILRLNEKMYKKTCKILPYSMPRIVRLKHVTKKTANIRFLKYDF